MFAGIGSTLNLIPPPPTIPLAIIANIGQGHTCNTERRKINEKNGLYSCQQKKLGPFYFSLAFWIRIRKFLGLPGLRSVSQRYGSGFEIVHHKAKIVKNLYFYCYVIYL
jgi:hypothetical protein